MGVETAVMGGMSLLGGLAGSQKSGGGTAVTNQNTISNQTSSQNPGAWQMPYIYTGLNGAQNAITNSLNNPVYTGQRVADLNPTQLAAIAKGGSFANNNYGNAQNLMDTSTGLMNTGASFGSNASNLFNKYSGDPTSTILANANQYANNPYVNGLVDASSRDVTRNLYENQLPTLAKAAAGSGNTNSTRAGVENAIAQRGAADRLADISSQIRSQFFGKGLDQAQNQYNQNLANSLNINNQLANAYGAGVNGINSATNVGTNLFNLGANAGNLQYANEQAKDTAAMNQFNEGNTNPLTFLNSYWNLAGKPLSSSGSTSGTGYTYGTQEQPSYGGGLTGALSGALGGLASGYGMRNAFGSGDLGSSLQSMFSQTGLGSSGFGTGLAYGNQDYGNYF